MKIISKKQFLINNIIEKTKPFFHRDVPELNDILYKNKYFESTNISWFEWLKQKPVNKLNNLWDDLKNSNL